MGFYERLFGKSQSIAYLCTLTTNTNHTINMKRLLLYVMTLAAMTTHAQNTPVSQMEPLDRGLVALPATTGSGNFVSWRLLGTDNEATTTFDLLRGGKTVKSGLKVTNYIDTGGNSLSEYQVVTLVDGIPTDTSSVAKAWSKSYLKMKLKHMNIYNYEQNQ